MVNVANAIKENGYSWTVETHFTNDQKIKELEVLDTKRFIMIGGANRSGTTLLNLIIANDPRGMALGEVGNLFRPHMQEHESKLQELKKEPIWAGILEDSPKNLYRNLVQAFPEIDFFVDSTKLPEWYEFQIKCNPDINFKNIVSFKHPEDQVKSLIKRHGQTNWELVLENYYQRYFYTLPNFRSISLHSLLESQENLKNLCEFLEIPYTEDKLDYWNKKHPNFFGSDTIKKKFIDRSGIKKFRNIEDLEGSQFDFNETIKNIYQFLLDREIWLNEPTQDFYQISTFRKYYISFRNMLALLILKAKYNLFVKKA